MSPPSLVKGFLRPPSCIHQKFSTPHQEEVDNPLAKKRRTCEEASLLHCDVASLLQSLRSSGAAPEERVREVSKFPSHAEPTSPSLMTETVNPVTVTRRVQFVDDLNSFPLEEAYGPHTVSSKASPNPILNTPADVARLSVSAAEWARIRTTIVKQQSIFSEQVSQLHSLVQTQRALARDDSGGIPKWASLDKEQLRLEAHDPSPRPMPQADSHSLPSVAAPKELKSSVYIDLTTAEPSEGVRCKRKAQLVADKLRRKGPRGAEGATRFESNNSSACSTSFASGVDEGRASKTGPQLPRNLPKSQNDKVHADSSSPSLSRSKSTVVDSTPPHHAPHPDFNRRKRKTQEGVANGIAAKGLPTGAAAKLKLAGAVKVSTPRAPHWARGCKVLPGGMPAVAPHATSSLVSLPHIPQSNHVPPSPLPTMPSSNDTWQSGNASLPAGLPVSPFWQYYAAFAAGYSASVQRLRSSADGGNTAPQLSQQLMGMGAYSGYPGAASAASFYSSPGDVMPATSAMTQFPGFMGASSGMAFQQGPSSWPYASMSSFPGLNSGVQRVSPKEAQVAAPSWSKGPGNVEAFVTPPPLRLFHDEASRQHLVAADNVR